MNFDDLKHEIAEKTGIPAYLLTADSVNGLFEQANSLLTLQNEQRQQTTADQFSEWFCNAMDIEQDSQNGNGFIALDQIKKGILGDQQDIYPVVRDGGSIDPAKLPSSKSNVQWFEEWLNDKLQFNPSMDHDGWVELW